jgi:hypothetical protein
MPKRRFPVQPVGVAFLCENCNQGLAVATGSTDPAGLHRHQCNNCKFIYFFEVKYPTIEWRFPKIEDVQSLLEKEDEKEKNAVKEPTSEEGSGLKLV